MVNRIYTLTELQNIILPIASDHGVNRVYIFGSYARNQAKATSDVDLLIDSGEVKSLFQMSAFRLALEDALGKSVDILTTKVDDPHFLTLIAKEQVLLYDRAA